MLGSFRHQVRLSGIHVPTPAMMVAVVEKTKGDYQLISTDCLHDLTPLSPESFKGIRNQELGINDDSEIRNRELGINDDSEIRNRELGISDHSGIGNRELGISEIFSSQFPTAKSSFHSTPNSQFLKPQPPTSDEQQALEKWLKGKVQFPLMQEESSKRKRELQIRQDYLKKAMDAAISEAKKAYIMLSGKVAKGDDTYRVARDNAQNKVRTLTERYQNKQHELTYLQLVRPGRLVYLGTALVVPPVEPALQGMRNDPEVEAIAMEYVMNYERDRGWTPEDISQRRDGSGFDIRSVGKEDETTGTLPIRRIEVKGRSGINQDVSLTSNEWRKAQQLGDTYWLYVVWNCKGEQPQLLTIQNPALVLAGEVKEVKQVTRYVVGAETLAKIGVRD